jgi:hypothetical protein
MFHPISKDGDLNNSVLCMSMLSGLIQSQLGRTVLQKFGGQACLTNGASNFFFSGR